MEKIQKELETIDRKLVEAEKTISQSEGSIKTLIARLKEDFNLSDEQEGEEEVEKLTTQLESLESQIKENFSELRKKYQW